MWYFENSRTSVMSSINREKQSGDIGDPTSEATIEILKQWFSVHGIPKELHSDNGPQYDSFRFKEFCNDCKFKHVTSSPKHPRSNGLAERYVQTAKNMLKKCTKDKSDVKLALMLMRATPTENLPAPCERLLGRRIRTPITVAKKEA
jgi:transposase InsO family protein